MSLLLVLFILASIANLVYWIKSLIVMKNETLFLILGIFLSPFAQIGFMLSKRDTIDDEQATTIKRYFMVFGVWFVLYIIFMVMAAGQVAAESGAM